MNSSIEKETEQFVKLMRSIGVTIDHEFVLNGYNLALGKASDLKAALAAYARDNNAPDSWVWAARNTAITMITSDIGTQLKEKNPALTQMDLVDIINAVNDFMIDFVSFLEGVPGPEFNHEVGHLVDQWAEYSVAFIKTVFMSDLPLGEAPVPAPATVNSADLTIDELVWRATDKGLTVVVLEGKAAEQFLKDNGFDIAQTA
jgi:hypothetical protein